MIPPPRRHRPVDALSGKVDRGVPRQYPVGAYALKHRRYVGTDFLIDCGESTRLRSMLIFDRGTNHAAGIRDEIR